MKRAMDMIWSGGDFSRLSPVILVVIVSWVRGKKRQVMERGMFETYLAVYPDEWLF